MATPRPHWQRPRARLTSGEKAELTAAKRRIAELETELAIHRRASELLGKVVPPKAVHGDRGDGRRRTARADGYPHPRVSESGYYEYRGRGPSARDVRHALLTDLIREVHVASRGTYGARRVHAELTLGRGLVVSRGTVELLMHRAHIQGVTGRPGWRRGRPDLVAKDLVQRQFSRSGPNQLWVTDITEQAREGKLYCAVVLDVYSRRVAGWSIDASPTAALVTNALGMAIDSRRPAAGAIIHSDQGVQGGSWAFTDRAKASGLVPSMGSVGDCFDNSMVEAFWSRMQVELLDRQSWRTRIELANAIFEYLEI